MRWLIFKPISFENASVPPQYTSLFLVGTVALSHQSSIIAIFDIVIKEIIKNKNES